jgi:pimeloyl-ACP methyl ester carboxylesterase
MAKKKHLTAFDIQGFTRIATDSVLGVTDIVEAMHRQILHPPLLPSTPIQNFISRVANIGYESVKISTKIVGKGLDKFLGHLDLDLNTAESSPEKETLISIMNGVFGDYLEESKNPLSISMTLRYQGKLFEPQKASIKQALPNINGKILLMAHGLCMNDLLWTRNGHNHGEELAKELGFTSIYLHYNTGLNISTNGQSFAIILEQLIANWPVPIEEVVILTHSMGGLISRSALHYGQTEKKAWTKHINKLIFLGTPHHGSHLEKAGYYLHTVLEAIPYVKPFGALGKIRSAGITDLRYGNLVDEDWAEMNRFKKKPEGKRHIPLPPNVACYNVSGTLAKEDSCVSDRLSGDGIVPLESSLGKDKNSDKTLNFKKSSTFISYECGHMALLYKPEIYQQLKLWLSKTI